MFFLGPLKVSPNVSGIRVRSNLHDESSDFTCLPLPTRQTTPHQPPKSAVATTEEIEEIRTKVSCSLERQVTLPDTPPSSFPKQTNELLRRSEARSRSGVLSKLKSGIADLRHMSLGDLKALLEVQKKHVFREKTDDKTYLMEDLIRIAAALPDDSWNGRRITDGFLDTLWNDLEHPPLSPLGSMYRFRQADGSYNNLQYPHIGAANTPYARSVKPLIVKPGALPDPGIIFDSVMARKSCKPHPAKISSFLSAVATVIIHDLFRTDHEDFNNSKTSSYLDLSPLYGSIQVEQDTVRTFKDGKLKPDCFSEKRLASFPPSAGCLLIMFNRFHNYVVEQLALINEDGRFTLPNMDGNMSEMDDEELFQTGRLITCGLYINIILIDYVRTILNLNHVDSNWQLNPRADIPGTPIATGNQVSAEFNIIYRWHQMISERDELWVQELWDRLFPGVDARHVGMAEFLERLSSLTRHIDDDPLKRTIDGLKRAPDGRFDDDDLIKIITESIDEVSNAFGAQSIPKVMRPIEILGIMQAREWQLCTLNELRSHFGLTPHKTFEDINPDPEVAEQLRRLYDHPDYVELYPGLVAEAAKEPLIPGSGLCPSFTISRAVLADAVTLVRGDRFYTLDYFPKKLTHWGYAEVQYDLDVDNGCVFYKLFSRAFPQHFEPNSAYAHYPLTIPAETKSILTKLGRADLYSFGRPHVAARPQLVSSHHAAKAVVTNHAAFEVALGSGSKGLVRRATQDFALAENAPYNTAGVIRKLCDDTLYESKWSRDIKDYYEKKTCDLLKRYSYKVGGANQVDIIRDVGNLVPVHFCADLFSLPLKSEERPMGIFTEHQMWSIMASMSAPMLAGFDAVGSFSDTRKAHHAASMLDSLVRENIQSIISRGIFSRVMDAVHPKPTRLTLHGISTMRRLLNYGTDIDELVRFHILGATASAVPAQAHLLAHALEYFLTDGREHLPAIRRLATIDSREADRLLSRYLLEATRLQCETVLVRHVARTIQLRDGERILRLVHGDKVWINLRAASRDPAVFPNPDHFDLTRDMSNYIHTGVAERHWLGRCTTLIAVTAMLKSIVKMNGLRPAPGPQGRIAKVLRPLDGGDDETASSPWRCEAFLTERHDRYSPFPISLKVNWDDEKDEGLRR